MRDRRLRLKDLSVAERQWIVAQVEIDGETQAAVAREHRVSAPLVHRLVKRCRQDP